MYRHSWPLAEYALSVPKVTNPGKPSTIGTMMCKLDQAQTKPAQDKAIRTATVDATNISFPVQSIHLELSMIRVSFSQLTCNEATNITKATPLTGS